MVRLIVEIAYDQDQTDGSMIARDVRELLEMRGGQVQGLDGVENVWVDH